MADYDENGVDFEETPLHRHRAFGAGIKRKRIDFVPQSNPAEVATTSTTPKQGAGDLYLSIVLSKKPRGGGQPEAAQLIENSHAKDEEKADKPSIVDLRESSGERTSVICSTCNRPITTSISQHETTLHHQLSLPHSHPPSSIDRTSRGLGYLSSYGWDPDARLGLGVAGSGRLHPVRATDRSDKDKLGLGATQKTVLKAIKEKKLDAVETKKKEEEIKARAARLRQLVFNSDEVNKHLGLEL